MFDPYVEIDKLSERINKTNSKVLKCLEQLEELSQAIQTQRQILQILLGNNTNLHGAVELMDVLRKEDDNEKKS